MTQVDSYEEQESGLRDIIDRARGAWEQSPDTGWPEFADRFAADQGLAYEPLWEFGVRPHLEDLGGDDARRNALQNRDGAVAEALNRWYDGYGHTLEAEPEQEAPDDPSDESSYEESSEDESGAESAEGWAEEEDDHSGAPEFVKLIGMIGGTGVKQASANIPLDQFLSDIGAFAVPYTRGDLESAVDAFMADQSKDKKERAGEGVGPAQHLYGSLIQCSYWEGEGSNGYQKVWTVAVMAADADVDSRNASCVNALAADGDQVYYTQLGGTTVMDVTGQDPLFCMARYCGWGIGGAGAWGLITRENRTFGRNTLIVGAMDGRDDAAVKAALRKFTDKQVEFE